MSGNLSGPLGEYELSGTYDYSERFFGTDAALNGAGPRIAFGRGKTELFGAPLYLSFDAEYAKLLRRSRREREGVLTERDQGLNRFDLYPVLQFSVQPLALPEDRLDRELAGHLLGREPGSGQQGTGGRRGGPAVLRAVDPCDRSVVHQDLGHAEQRLLRANEAPDRALGGRLPRERHRRRASSIGSSASRASTRSSATSSSTSTVSTPACTRGSSRAGRESVAREILSASVTQSYYTDERAAQYDRSFRTSFSGTPPSNFSPVSVIVRAEPTRNLGGTVRMEFDPGRDTEDLLLAGGPESLERVPYLPLFRMGPMRTISAEGSYELGGWIATSGGWSQRRFIEGLSGFNRPSRLDNYINSSTSFRTPDNKFGGLYDFNYDIRQGRFLAQMIRLYYNAQCCGFRIDYQVFNFEGLGTRALIDRDRRFTLSFTLAGLGTFTNNFGGAGGGYR